MNADLQFLKELEDLPVDRLINNSEFLVFMQLYFNPERDNLSTIVNLYLSSSLQECMQFMKERNESLDKEMAYLFGLEDANFEIVEEEVVEFVPQNNKGQYKIIELLKKFKQEKIEQLSHQKSLRRNRGKKKQKLQNKVTNDPETLTNFLEFL